MNFKFIYKIQFADIYPFIVILFSSLLILNSFVKPGIPQTHDGNNHMARMANFYLVYQDRQFPPRWAPNLNYQYGYPVFNYNYYLPYIPGIIFYILGLNLETSFKLVTLIFLFSGGIFLYLFLKKYIPQIYALAASILFISSPPQILQIFVRGNIGETVSWAVFVIGLFLIQQLISSFKNKNLKLRIILFTLVTLNVWALLLSHNVTFLFGFPIWIIYALAETWLEFKKGRARILFNIFIALIFGLGLSAYFALAAFLELKYITLPYVALSKDFSDHFVYFWQLIWSKWAYGYSKVGWQEDGMSFQLGLIPLSLLLIGLFISFKNIGSIAKKNLLIYFYIFLLISSVFSMLPISNFFWQLIPFMQKIQFPWRLLFVSCFSLSVICGYILAKINHNSVAIIVIILSLLNGIFFAKPNGLLHQDDYFYFAFPFTSSVLHENLPQGFDQNKNIEYKKKLSDIKDLVKFNEFNWKSNFHSYEVDASENTEIIERLAFFPGWETYVDGNKVEIKSDNSNFPGLVTYPINKGHHLVKTIFTENTWARRIGDLISVTSILLLLVYPVINIKLKFWH